MKTIFFKALHILTWVLENCKDKSVWGSLYICSNSIGGKIVHISTLALCILILSWECHFPFWRLHWIHIFENKVSKEVAKKCGFLVRRCQYNILVALSSFLCPNQEQHNQKLEAKSRRPEIVFDDCCRNVICLSGYPTNKTSWGC